MLAMPMVTFEPPTWYPREPALAAMPLLKVIVEVATLVSAAVPLPYKSCEDVKVV